MEYASNGKANLGVTLGAIGTGVGLLGGGLGAILGGRGLGGCHESTPIVVQTCGNGRSGCGGNWDGVDRYEMSMTQQMANKDMEIAYWRGQDETNRKISDAYGKLEAQINHLACEVQRNKDEQNGINLQQAVYNGTNTAAIGCIRGQIDQLYSLTRLRIPNGNICPGWGDVTVAPVTSAAAAAAG